MGKRSGPLNYYPVANTDQDFPLLNSIVSSVKQYVVIAQGVVGAVRQIRGMWRNFSKTFRECELLHGSGPRCFIQTVAGWFTVNPADMPH